jgi:glycogen debranching enzyme
VNRPIARYVVDTPLGPVQLASDETLVSIERCEIELPQRRERPLDVLLRMAQVERDSDLGAHGPVVAALANAENANNPELRRYEATFGRDAFYAAEFLAATYPQLEEGTVRYFAAYQATATDERKQAAPGKIANHIRSPDDPLARRLTRESGRGWPWFGATDTTVQFLQAACRVVARDPAFVDELVREPHDRPAPGTVVERAGTPLTIARCMHDATQWVLRELSLSPPSMTGFLWAPMNRKDSFTVWTDSPNAFHFRDGRLSPPPVAPVQLQGQVHDALVALVGVADAHADLRAIAPEASRAAARLRARFFDAFVVSDDRGTFLANGLSSTADGHLSPLDVRTVNMGFVLDSQLLDGSDAAGLRAAIVDQLWAPEMTSPFGIVGRARDEVRFEKFDYHAQVWAFATHKVARGLARHGEVGRAGELDARVMLQTGDGLFPENVGAGDEPVLEYCPHVLTVERVAANGRTTHTVKERPPAPYAAWTAAAVVAIDDQRAR